MSAFSHPSLELMQGRVDAMAQQVATSSGTQVEALRKDLAELRAGLSQSSHTTAQVSHLAETLSALSRLTSSGPGSGPAGAGLRRPGDGN